jgi:prolyl 4-hydroxylase
VQTRARRGGAQRGVGHGGAARTRTDAPPPALPPAYNHAETVFPNVPEQNTGPEWSACARDALAYKPKAGSLILFWSLKPDGEIDMGTTHTACPVIRGEKWSAPLWIRQARLPQRRAAGMSLTQPPSAAQGPFQQSTKRATAAPNGERSTGDTCVDLHADCKAWAAAGECKKNAAYMIGELGQCRESCNACPYPKRARKLGGSRA